MRVKLEKLTTAQIIILSFAITILLGTGLLMLPISSIDGQVTNFIDALFTATSATCVTGLVVHDTATHWSVLGKGIIITLIQIGGMGVVTIFVTLNLLSGKRINLKQRSTIQEAISAPKMGGIIRFTGFIVKFSLFIELFGALCMFPVFGKEFGWFKGIFYSLFHSISAFCNAGFDLMGSIAPYSSLMYFVDNPIINIVICSLIVIGGIGFLTWDDIRFHKYHIHKYKLQTKIILITTAILIGFSSLYFFFFELSALPFQERCLASLFQAITPRTAGFNTYDFSKMSESGIMLVISLMLIGGSPGSTAGGIKLTTLAILVLTMISVFKKEESTHVFKRRIMPEAIRSSLAIVTLYISLFLIIGMIISRVENLPLLTCLFESASAVGTVGLTLGITPQLSCVSKVLLILLMYIGRVGGLTLIFSFLSTKKSTSSHLPQEKIFIG